MYGAPDRPKWISGTFLLRMSYYSDMINQANLAGIHVGDGYPVRVMGVINLSPESFFKGSVLTQSRHLAKTAEEMTLAGADFIDVGAMSSAPYLKTQISEEEESKRLSRGLSIIKKNTNRPISVDTSRVKPAEVALKAGAVILNDITGFAMTVTSQRFRPALGNIAREFQGVILMAHPVWLPHPSPSPIKDVIGILTKSLRQAERLKIPKSRIAVDPGIGFFRYPKINWWEWDVAVIRRLQQLKTLGRPIMVGLSRKSFIGHILGGKPPEDRLAGSLAATTAAVWNGAAIIRTHDVKETKEAIKIAESLKAD